MVKEMEKVSKVPSEINYISEYDKTFRHFSACSLFCNQYCNSKLNSKNITSYMNSLVTSILKVYNKRKKYRPHK